MDFSRRNRMLEHIKALTEILSGSIYTLDYEYQRVGLETFAKNNPTLDDNELKKAYLSALAFKKDDIERAQSMSKSTTSQIAHLATSLTAEELKAVKEFLAFTKTALYKKIANENPSNANKNYKLAEIKAVETTEGIVAECQKQK